MFWKSLALRVIMGFTLTLTASAIIGIGILVESKNQVFKQISTSFNEKVENEKTIPFPVSVNSHTEEITENPAVDTFFSQDLANAPSSQNNWWNKVVAFFSRNDLYQNLASPVGRIVVIWPGERKEEIAKNIGDILRWNKEDRLSFEKSVDESNPILTEGKYFPGQYLAHTGATPSDIQQLIVDEFQTEILNRYTSEVASQVPLKDALIIASLIEREASDFTNMRQVSGVIWNRLFSNMPLQLDATLQYVKGSNLNEPRWWPAVRPADKFIKSPYNTYQNAGLPPAPIANPSAEAILAALNPVVTDCLFYFHAKNKEYYCSETYEDHVAKLRSIYGRGS